MIAHRPASAFWMIGASALTATCVTWLMAPRLLQAPSLTQAAAIRQSAEPLVVLSPPRHAAPRVDQMRTLTAITSKIAYMMTADPGVKTSVWPEIATPPGGRHGIIIACSHPLYLGLNEPGMDDRKSWVILAVLACVKYTDDCPVSVDFIGFTDPEGLSGDRWYYQLEMGTAQRIHHQIRLGTLSMEAGYDEIASAWQRVTSATDL